MGKINRIIKTKKEIQKIFPHVGLLQGGKRIKPPTGPEITIGEDRALLVIKFPVMMQIITEEGNNEIITCYWWIISDPHAYSQQSELPDSWQQVCLGMREFSATVLDLGCVLKPPKELEKSLSGLTYRGWCSTESSVDKNWNLQTSPISTHEPEGRKLTLPMKIGTYYPMSISETFCFVVKHIFSLNSTYFW